MKIMGIINLTPDSFFQDSRTLSLRKIEKKIREFVKLNVDIIDIGAESSRPGSKNISIDEELNRLKPMFHIIKNYSNMKFSIDTYKSNIADICLNNGFSIINDIYAGRKDKKMFDIIKKYNASIILMHMKGIPENMQANTEYDNLIEEISEFFNNRIKIAINSGIDKKKIILDPGLGFGKSSNDNLLIIKNLSTFKKYNLPLLVGPSRKSFLSINNDRPSDRLPATITSTILAYQNGADIVRVHDVKEIKKSIEFNIKYLNYNKIYN